MIPIYEQESGKGIGHSVDSFINRFDEIWVQHLAEDRAQSFAFIFYDFTDSAVRRILKDQGVFAKLDRLSGHDLSIFYLHNGTRHSVEKFNKQFLAALEVTERAEPPCVVFFKFKEQRIEDIKIVQLDNADLIHGFGELYAVIEKYLADTAIAPTSSRTLRWVKSSAKVLGIELFRAALRRGLEAWP